MLTEVARVTAEFCLSRTDGAPSPTSSTSLARTDHCTEGEGPSMSDDTDTGSDLVDTDTGSDLVDTDTGSDLVDTDTGSDLFDTDTGGGLALTPPARNYSPWYQWMVRLGATVHDDPLPEDEPAALRAWVERRRAGLAELLGPEPEPVPLDIETLESVPATVTGGTRSCSTPRTPCRCPPICSCPTSARTRHPGRPSSPATATGPASRRWWGWSTPTCPTPTTRSSWPAGATWCLRRTCAASASGSTGTPRTITPATPISCTPPWRGGTP